MTHRNCKTEQLNALAHEAQTVIKHTRIDADAFIALDETTKAARWRQWDTHSKSDFLIQLLNRKDGEWSQELVDRYIAKYDARFGAEPLATEAAVDAALERLAAAHQQSANTAPSDDERVYFKRLAGTFRRARLYWLAGVRPTPVKGGWLVPSQQKSGPVHQVGRDGSCTCEAGSHGQACWHLSLSTGLQVGAEDLDRFDDATEVEAAPCRSAAALGQRIAEIRREVWMQQAA